MTRKHNRAVLHSSSPTFAFRCRCRLRGFSLIKALLVTLFLQSSKPSLTSASAASIKSVSPVVGVLSQPHYVSWQWDPLYYYIAGSYVKWIELAGARSIAIPYDASEELADEIFEQIDAIMFPGGGSDLPLSAERLWARFLQINEKRVASGDGRGLYVPMWATCLGYEYIVMMVASQGLSIVEKGFDSMNLSLPLTLIESSPYQSRLYSEDKLREIVTTRNVTFDNHGRGVDPESFRNDTNLTAMFHLTATSFDRQGREFVSSIEPVDPERHPIYGVQYHPEKNAFEYGVRNGTANVPYEAIDHSAEDIYYSYSLAAFFGEMLRTGLQSKAGQSNYTDFQRHPMVYSYPMVLSEEFEQKYVIPSASLWNQTKEPDEPGSSSEYDSFDTSTTTSSGDSFTGRLFKMMTSLICVVMTVWAA